jgi:hypothetical protein
MCKIKDDTNMKYCLIIILVLISKSGLLAQNDERILREIAYNLFDIEQINEDSILLERTVQRIIFDQDSTEFEKYMDCKVPRKIIEDWRSESESDITKSSWIESELNIGDTILLYDKKIEIVPYIKCVSDEEKDSILKRLNNNQYIYSISNLLIDETKENALFEITPAPYQVENSCKIVFIKKIYGLWVIVSSSITLWIE